MDTSSILTNVAVFFLAATLWDDMRRGGRATIAGKTWLLVGCLFAAVSVVLEVFVR
ncbi:MAG: hypothetical protein ACYTG0_09820 [Planctomycetota bacterium]|jgi:hypothetical protein